MEQFRLWPQILLITGIMIKSVLQPSLKIFLRCLKYKLCAHTKLKKSILVISLFVNKESIAKDWTDFILIYHRPSPAGQSRHLVIRNVWDSLKKKFLTLVVCLVSLIVCAGDKIARPVLADDSSSHYLSCITLHDNNTTSLFQHYKTNCAHSDLIFPSIPFLSKSQHTSKTLRLYPKFYFPEFSQNKSCFVTFKMFSTF